MKCIIHSYPNTSPCWNVTVLYCTFLPDMTSQLLQCKVVRDSTVTLWEPGVWTLGSLLFSHRHCICRITFTANTSSRNSSARSGVLTVVPVKAAVSTRVRKLLLFAWNLLLASSGQKGKQSWRISTQIPSSPLYVCMAHSPILQLEHQVPQKYW